MNSNQSAGQLKDTDSLMPEVFARLAKRAEHATHDRLAAERVLDLLQKRRDEWLSRVHSQKDYRLCYQTEGAATVGLLEHASLSDWEMFTCLDSLRDVEGTADLVLDQRPSGLRTD